MIIQIHGLQSEKGNTEYSQKPSQQDFAYCRSTDLYCGMDLNNWIFCWITY